MNGAKKVLMPFWKKVLSILFCGFLIGGCGYQLVGKETHLPPGITSIAIPTFANQTFEPGVEIPFTQAFLREFIRDRRVKVLDKVQADSILEGTIKSFNLQSASYDENALVLEYQATVVMDLTLKRRSGEIIWKENNVSETGWYRTSSSVLANEVSKSGAILDIGAVVAERIRKRFFYNF